MSDQGIEAANAAFRDAKNTGRRVEAAVEAATPHILSTFIERLESEGAVEAANRALLRYVETGSLEAETARAAHDAIEATIKRAREAGQKCSRCGTVGGGGKVPDPDQAQKSTLSLVPCPACGEGEASGL